MISLTKRESQVLNILWKAEVSMSLNDIHLVEPKLSKNTIPAVLRRLTSKGMIEVKDIGYSGTVLTRKYVAKIRQEDVLLSGLSDVRLHNLIIQCIDKTADCEKLAGIESHIRQRRAALSAGPL